MEGGGRIVEKAMGAPEEKTHAGNFPARPSHKNPRAWDKKMRAAHEKMRASRKNPRAWDKKMRAAREKMRASYEKMRASRDDFPRGNLHHGTRLDLQSSRDGY